MSDALDDAAAAALWPIRHEPKEHIGLLYGDDYARSRLLTRGNSGEVRGSFQIPAGSLRAIFHNHPAGTRERERAQFSEDDLKQALRSNVPSYISAGERVMKYEPGGKAEEVLAQFPIDEFRAYLMRTLLERAADDPRGLMR